VSVFAKSGSSGRVSKSFLRLELPFEVLSDAGFKLCDALRLPTFEVPVAPALAYKGSIYAEINDRIVRYSLPVGGIVPTIRPKLLSPNPYFPQCFTATRQLN
jgi:hypothetical protein